MSLADYRRKRNFARTREPAPAASAKRSARSRRFVIQKHDASRLHYDLRLELGGAYKSWAVPKGLPSRKGEKRLAVQVEDHPLAYGNFEGTIPEGEYGGGTVMLWDRGTYDPLTTAPARDLKAGKLHFTLAGEKLRGEWYLVRLKEANQWLVIKGGESTRPVSARDEDRSVASGKRMRELAEEVPPESVAEHAGKPGRKPPAFVEPMKARLVATPPAGEWLYEIKFDGWRALALKQGTKVQLMSRTAKDMTTQFPEIGEAVGQLPAKDLILDGEIVALDDEGRSSFQLLQSAAAARERPDVCFFVFDLLLVKGRDLTGLPLAERRAALEQLCGGGEGVIRFSETLGSDARKLLRKAAGLGLEGLIGKRAGSLYESGKRSGEWIKLKLHHEQEFVIGGYTPPAGSRVAFGALIVGVYQRGKLMAAGKVGTGFDTAVLRDLVKRFRPLASPVCPFANLPASTPGRWGQGITAAEMKRCHWLRPELVCQVKFAEWTGDGRLRQPVYLGLRVDKEAKEVIREKAAK